MELLQNLGSSFFRLMNEDVSMTASTTTPSKSMPNLVGMDKNSKFFYANGKDLHPYDSCTVKKVFEMNQHLFPHSGQDVSFEVSLRDYQKKIPYECSSHQSNQIASYFDRLMNNSQNNNNHVLRENLLYGASQNIRVNQPHNVIAQNSLLSSTNSSSVSNGDHLPSKESSHMSSEQQSIRSNCIDSLFENVFNSPKRPSSGLSASVSLKNSFLKECQMPSKEEVEGDNSNQSSFLSTGDTFDDKSLVDESKNLINDDTEVKKQLELRKGMFKCVYMGGPVQKYIKIQEHYSLSIVDECRIREWGWILEKKTKSPIKCPKSSKDLKGYKRKLPFDLHSSLPKKLAPSPNENEHVQSNGRESVCNNKTSSQVSTTEKVKINKPPSCFSNSGLSHNQAGKKFSHIDLNHEHSKPSRSLATDKRSVRRIDCLEKQPKEVIPHKERKEAPALMPSSDGNHKPRNNSEIFFKSSKAIDDVTMGFISSKKDKRSSIYSGKKIAHVIPPLKALSLNALKKNISKFPPHKISQKYKFKYIKQYVEMFSATNLYMLEKLNKDLSKNTSYIWENLYKKEFRNQPYIAGQPWKEIYWNARNKRENKFKSLTASISNGKAKAQPERQVKLMDVKVSNPDIHSKKKMDEPPKIILNGRVNGYISNGKDCGSNISPKTIRNEWSSSSSNVKLNFSNTLPKVPVEASSSNSKSSSSESSTSPESLQKTSKIIKPLKKTVAPLMSKTKKMLNLVNRRR